MAYFGGWGVGGGEEGLREGRIMILPFLGMRIREGGGEKGWGGEEKGGGGREGEGGDMGQGKSGGGEEGGTSEEKKSRGDM